MGDEPQCCNIAILSGNFNNFKDKLVGQTICIQQNILYNLYMQPQYRSYTSELIFSFLLLEAILNSQEQKLLCLTNIF